MPTLAPSEYDAGYFDGRDQAIHGVRPHNAGYAKYRRWLRDWENTTGEMWSDKAALINANASIGNKQVLEIGCAKGFLVKDLRDLGADAYGLDVSEYAVDNIEPGMESYITQGDARSALANYNRNQFDLVISLRFLECIAEPDLPNLISEMARISRHQYHVIDTRPPSAFYVVHDLAWWADQFPKFCTLIQNENWQNVITT